MTKSMSELLYGAEDIPEGSHQADLPTKRSSNRTRNLPMPLFFSTALARPNSHFQVPTLRAISQHVASTLTHIPQPRRLAI